MPNVSSVLRPLSLALSASALLFTGCANMATTATTAGSSALAGAAIMGGHIHGGQQPVSNADVRLYSIGTTGYGSAPTLLADTSTDPNGNFSFSQVSTAVTGISSTYACPSAGAQLYVTAKGGNTQGSGNGSNTASYFILAIGQCSTAATKVVDMDEVTTVATMAALQQYFSPANANTDNLNHLGAPNSTQGALGYSNAVGNIANLANLATGNVNAPFTVSATPAGSTSAVAVTITPEVQKINTLADIIGACTNTVSSTSPECNILFANAVPPNSSQTSQPALSFGTATDVVQALYYMLTNPTSGSATNLNNLYNLQGPGGPFQPSETFTPTDWTVGLKYSGSATTTCAGGTTGTNPFLTYPYHIAIDASGNMWSVSNISGGNLIELGANGVPLTCTLGSTIGASTGMAIDTAGNIWASSQTATNIYKYNPTAASATTVAITGEAVGSQYVAIDKNNDVFISQASTGTSIFEVVAGGPVVTTASSSVGASPFFLGVDTAGNVFSTDSSTTNNFYALNPPTTGTAYTTTNIGTASSVSNSYGAQAGLSGKIAVVNGNNSASTASNTLTLFSPSTGAAGGFTPSFTSTQASGGLVGPREIAIDGAGNIWSASSTKPYGDYASSSASAVAKYAVVEFSATGVALSPTGAVTIATSGAPSSNGGFQKDAAVLPLAPRSVAVDPSGNVWFGSNSSAATGVLVLVGAAVPVVTPIASALAVTGTAANGVSKP